MSPVAQDDPARPVPGLHEHPDFNGLNAREYAAIALCVPDSGTEWLDAMIDQRRRDDFAKAAMPQGFFQGGPHGRAKEAYGEADAMIAASKKGGAA